MSHTPTRATAFAPATVGNVAVGFDILGHSLAVAGDRVTVTRIGEPAVRLTAITGLEEELPTAPQANAATAGLLRLVEELELDFGFAVELDKGIPLGSGMGGSAASAVAALVAAAALLPERVSRTRLLQFALAGEVAATGSAHADNVAPALFGGLTLVRPDEPVVRIPVPLSVRCVLVRPHVRLFTRRAREVLPATISLADHIQQSANLAGFLAGCYAADVALIGRSLRDLVAEPARAALVPGFGAVQAAAIEAGALGCSLSGSGPSVFAWCSDQQVALGVRHHMVSAFVEQDIGADGWISPVNAPPARVVEVG